MRSLWIRLTTMVRRVRAASPISRSSRRKATKMSKDSDRKTQAETTRKQAEELKDDGFSPDPEIARKVGGDRAAEDTKTDPPADTK